MENVITYKGMKGTVKYDKMDHMFYGKLEGVQDFILFEGKNMYLLQSAFRQVVDEYLEKILIA